MRPTRRQFLSAAGAAGLALSGCGGGGGDGEFRGQKLRIFVYAGGHEQTMREAFVPAFEKLTRATAVLDPGWWGSTAKLKLSPKGQPAYDLMVSDATEGYPAIRDGLFQQIDRKRVPNAGNLSPCVLENWVYQKGYGVTFPDSVMTLAYHKTLTPFAPQRWDDLLRPEVKQKVALYNSFYMSLYTFACMKAARDGRPGTAAALVDKDLDGVLKFAKEHRDQVKIWWPTSSDMAGHLVQQNCSLGNMHSPEMLKVLREHPELGAVVPEADRAFVQVMWLIPDGTPRKQLAEVALNLIFSEEMQLVFARLGAACAVPSVAALMAREDALWKQIYPSTEAQLKEVRYYPYDAYFRDWDHVNEVWDREVLRKG
jgi:spermidine/putrescine-binding protein